ncbi:tetratricopeptide repeat protein [Paraburkholderia sp. BCC1886]|uniref:tetratricopeptide repeat protein n=1 Tax=Paraburkholderia sp. BCC1886 TaxID=2562670 RepID=UPI001182DF62|nr:tetratricopeptide repeat protein [Paraburkholderia sp. BCC1886]
MTSAPAPLDHPVLTPEEQFEQDIQTVLASAIAEHQNGFLDEAEKLYRIILDASPQHVDAHYNLGALSILRRRPEAAISHFEIAVGARPNDAQYWLSYIDALCQAGETEAAQLMVEAARQRELAGSLIDKLVERLSTLAG